MAPGRADVIVAGSVIPVEVMERFGFDEAIVSETDILDGLVLGMLETPDARDRWLNRWSSPGACLRHAEVPTFSSYGIDLRPMAATPVGLP